MTTELVTAQEEVWRLYAQSYDRILPLMPYYQEVLHRHFEAIDRAIAGPVIDIAAGTGTLVELLMATERDVTAVDNSPAMLARLLSKPRLQAQVGKRLRILQASAENLEELESGYFSAAGILLALFNMGDPRAALDEAIRLIRPQGVLVVTELKRCFSIEPILNACRRQIEVLGRADELRDDLHRVVRANEALAPGTSTVIHVEDVFDLLVERGFREISIRDSHFGQCATVMGLKP